MLFDCKLCWSANGMVLNRPLFMWCKCIRANLFINSLVFVCIFIQWFIPISYKTKYLLVLHVYRFEVRPSKWRTELPGGDHVYQVETIDEIMLTEEDLDNEPLFILHLALVNFYYIFTKFGIHTTMILPQYVWVANTYQKILRAKKTP